MFDSGRIGANLREGGFILVCLLLVYLIVVLLTYSENDPSFSTTAVDEIVSNAGGIFGAYVSSMLFELFGRSSYLLCLIIFIFCWALLLKSTAVDEYNKIAWWAAIAGVMLFMMSSSSLEYLRFHHNDGLPAGAGGLVGKLTAPMLVQWFGLFGASLMLLGIWLLSWSLAAGLSWFAFLEMIGGAAEKIVLFFLSVKRHQTKNEARHVQAPPPSPVIMSAVKRRKHRVFKEEGEESFTQSSKPPQSSSPKEKAPATTALPTIELLDAPPADNDIDESFLSNTSQLIESSLADFNIKAVVAAVHPGPIITRYDIQPATGVKGAMVVNLARDLARALSVASIRVLENISGTNYIGLEIPNRKRCTVVLSEVLSSAGNAGSNAALPLALGKTAAGDIALVDLAAMPHLLVAGATGTGKSVFVNAVLLSLLYARTPAEMRLLLIDPKMLELAVYADIPHLLAPVVTDMQLAPAALHWAVEEMEARYRNMAAAGVRHIKSYNEAAADGKLKDAHGSVIAPLPYIAVVIDELADLMMIAGKKVEISISRLAQKARAAGIHIVLATQRPSVDVITGLIKANIPCRLSFQVASKIDSRTILDQAGAETLLGKGDMLYLPSGSGVPQRLHGAFVSDEEVSRVVAHVREQAGGVHGYLTDFSEELAVVAGDGRNGSDSGNEGAGEADPLYDQAVQMVIDNKRASISLVQRKLRIGYNRAARLVEAMEVAGVVTPMNEFGIRKLIVKK